RGGVADRGRGVLARRRVRFGRTFSRLPKSSRRSHCCHASGAVVHAARRGLTGSRVATSDGMRSTRAILAVLLCAPHIPRDAAAQSRSRVDAAAGYAWLRDQDAEVTFSRGWFASIGENVSGPFGIAAEIRSNNQSQSDAVTQFSMRVLGLMAGPRVAAGSGRVRPFAQMLFGIARFTTTYEMSGDTLSDSTKEFAMQYGGGVDVYFADH